MDVLENQEMVDWGQKPCYKCGSKARLREIKHDILEVVYDVCCTNPKCGNATSRCYMWPHRAVEAWNKKPTIKDRFCDRLNKHSR